MIKSSEAQAPMEERGSGTSEQRRRELADFLRTRREKLKPEQVGIEQVSRRRTPGLRREEVAELAGVGTTWYTWLEQARDIQPSSEVLRRLGSALQLNSAELRHMFALAGKAVPVDFEELNAKPSESLLRTLNHAIQVPALLLGQRWDVLAANASGQKMFSHVFELPVEKRNWLYFVFCARQSRQLASEWEKNARRLIAEFRASLSESLDHPQVTELVESLKRESSEFAQWWRDHDVRDNAPVLLEVNDETRGRVVFERSVLHPAENTKYRILIFSEASF